MGTSVSRAMLAHIRTILAALAAFALTLILAPSALFADGENESAASGDVQVDSGANGEDPVAASFDAERSGARVAASKGSGEAATPNSISPNVEAIPTLDSILTGQSTSIISADVALDGDEPLIGSFAVDGLTYSVGSDGGLALVSVDSTVTSDGTVSIPESVTYDGVTYPVTGVAPYAFYLSGATSVELTASITSVDSRAFRSSDVARVDVAADSPNLASFDGALYSADKSCLLLIPEGRAGAVLLPETAEVVESSKFSHCSLVDAISAEEGGANFASWEGLLYDASGQTLLRVPAGATEITIRDGCTTIAAGAMEGCASLERIHAPASVTSISPDVFTSVPTIALPAQTALCDEENPGVASSLLGQSNASTNFVPQLTAMVALSSADDDLAEIDASSVVACIGAGENACIWEDVGFRTVSDIADKVSDESDSPSAVVAQANAHKASAATTVIVGRLVNLYIIEPTTNTFLSQIASMAKEDYQYLEYTGSYSSFRFYNGRFWYYNQVGGPITVNANSAGGGISMVKYSPSATGPWTNLPSSATYTTLPYGTWFFAINGSERNVLASWDTNGGGAIADRLVYNDSSLGSTGGLPTPNASLRGTGWTFDGWFTNENFTDRVTLNSTAPNSVFVTYYARWRCNTIWDANGGAWDNGQAVSEIDAFAADGAASVSVPATPIRVGFIFLGWFDAPEGGNPLKVESEQAQGLLPGSRVYAQWEPAISADVPLEVTARVDLLGIEEQAEASGYIESRSGAALKVAEVSFEPLPGAAQLFGAHVPDVFLEVLAQGSTAADLRFALDAAVAEADASKLAPFALPGGYGTRVGVAYRFAIPDDVLAGIDQARFEGVTTPVGQVVYTVALAG